MFFLTPMDELINTDQVESVHVEKIVENETEFGELLPPEEWRDRWIVVATMLSGRKMVVSDQPTEGDALHQLRELVDRWRV
jgi:hypothetical protein